MQQNQNNAPQGVPAKVAHKIRLIEASSLVDLEKQANKFLETITEERRLISTALMVNSKTGVYIQTINYQDIRPYTPEEKKERDILVRKFMEVEAPQDTGKVNNFGN